MRVQRAWVLVVVAAAAVCAAQTSQPAAGTTTPADAKEIRAKVIEVIGEAQQRTGDGEWGPVRADDAYGPLTQIRTGIGGSVKLQIGTEEPYTALVIDPVSTVVLSEAFTTSSSKRVRVGVGHGRIRAGVAEGGLKSDFIVDSPVATLSKRGTWNFGLYYERSTDRFEMFLLDHGLVEALSKVTAEMRQLKPGEAVTHAMRRWGDEAQLRRNISIMDALGQDDLTIAFNRLRNDGIGVVDPGSGRSAILDLRNPEASAEFRNLVQNQLSNLPPVDIGPIDFGGGGGGGLRPEGFFGSGRGDQLIQVLIQQNSSLVQKGWARPGPLTFRRSALEGYLRGGSGSN
jgi:hypothetical protein